MAKAKNKYDVTYSIGASDETAAGLKTATASLTSPIDTITAKWATLDRAIGLSAGVYLAGKAFNLLEKAFQQFAVAVEQQQKRISFDNLARSVGSSSTKIISELKKASNETITYQKAVETAGRSILLGLDAEILPRLMEIAKASSKVTGQTVVAAYEDITLGVARQSKMILDNLGILVDYDKHLVKLARTLGKAKDNLTDTERRQAFLNATMDAGEKIVNKVGISYETAKEKLDKYMTSLADSKDALTAHITGLTLVDRAIGAQRYPLLVEQYEKGKKALDELLPKYNKLKEAMEAIKKGEREPSGFLAEQFMKAEKKVKSLREELEGISEMLGVESASKKSEVIIDKWTEEDDKKFFERQEKLVDWAAKMSEIEAEYWRKFDEDFAKSQDDRFKGVMDNLDANMAEIEAKLKAEEERVKNKFGYRLGASLGEGFSFGAKTTISNGMYDLITDEFNAKSALANALKLGARLLSDSFTEEFLKTLGLKFNPAKFLLNLFTNAGQAVGTGVISGGASSSVSGGGSSLTGYRSGVGTAARGATNNTFNYYITDDPTLQKRINEGVRKSFRDNNLRQDVKGLS